MAVIGAGLFDPAIFDRPLFDTGLPLDGQEVVIVRQQTLRGYYNDGVWWESLDGADAQITDVVSWEPVTEVA